MKKINLLIPIVTTVAGIAPVVAMTSCQKADAKLLTTKDSYLWYTHKVAGSAQGDDIEVTVETKSGADLSTYDENLSSASTFTVGADGKISFYISFDDWAPSRSTQSVFDLTFTNVQTNAVETIKDLKFNYVVDYGAELKDGYTAQTAKTAEYWTEHGGFQQYITDVLKDNNIFQNDARYTTAERIKSSQSFTGLESFKAYFNDIIKLTDGLHIHMNYQLKGTRNDSQFVFTLTTTNGTKTYKFTDFNFSFSFEPNDGYTLQLTEPANDAKKIYVVDESGNNYKLDGTFNGSFKVEITTSDGKNDSRVVNYNDTIDNYHNFDDSKDEDISAMLAFGVIHETYAFDWGAAKTVLSILSPYAANCQA